MLKYHQTGTSSFWLISMLKETQISTIENTIKEMSFKYDTSLGISAKCRVFKIVFSYFTFPFHKNNRVRKLNPAKQWWACKPLTAWVVPLAYSNNADASVSISFESLNQSLKLPVSLREVSGANTLNSVHPHPDNPSLNYMTRAQTDFSGIKLVTDKPMEKYTPY